MQANTSTSVNTATQSKSVPVNQEIENSDLISPFPSPPNSPNQNSDTDSMNNSSKEGDKTLISFSSLKMILSSNEPLPIDPALYAPIRKKLSSDDKLCVLKRGPCHPLKSYLDENKTLFGKRLRKCSESVFFRENNSNNKRREWISYSYSKKVL